jgi:Bromodomain
LCSDCNKLTWCSDAKIEITLEFYEKPSKRDYPDYYRQITHPTALKDIQKAVSNNKFPTWEAFITEVEYLWENARAYNEEGSFIYENANKLRVCLAFPCLLDDSDQVCRTGS